VSDLLCADALPTLHAVLVAKASSANGAATPVVRETAARLTLTLLAETGDAALARHLTAERRGPALAALLVSTACLPASSLDARAAGADCLRRLCGGECGGGLVVEGGRPLMLLLVELCGDASPAVVAHAAGCLEALSGTVIGGRASVARVAGVPQLLRALQRLPAHTQDEHLAERALCQVGRAQELCFVALAWHEGYEGGRGGGGGGRIIA
jgi:hypothetical protein